MRRSWTGVDPAAIRPGDLLLVKTPRLAYGFGRWFARHPYDHVGVVASGGQVVNVVKPAAVLTPLSRMLAPVRKPVLMRPSFRSDEGRARFVGALEALVGCQFDMARAWTLLAAVLLKQFSGLRVPLRPPPPADGRWVCSDAVLVHLLKHVAGFEEIRALPLDWNQLRCGTINDFFRIARERPDLLQRIDLPDGRDGAG